MRVILPFQGYAVFGVFVVWGEFCGVGNVDFATAVGTFFRV